MNTEELLQDFQRVSKLLQGREFSYHPNQAINKGIVGSKEEFDTIVNNLIQSGELIKMGSRQVEWNGKTINKNFYRIPDYTLPRMRQEPEEPIKVSPLDGKIIIPKFNFVKEVKEFSPVLLNEVAYCSGGTMKELGAYADKISQTPLNCSPCWKSIVDLYDQNPELENSTCMEDWYLRWFLYKHFQPVQEQPKVEKTEPVPDTEIPF